MIIINDDGCIKCGACEGTCPTSAIELTPTTLMFVQMVHLKWKTTKLLKVLNKQD